MQNICTNKAKIGKQHWWNPNNNPEKIPSSKSIHLIQIKLKCREPAVKPGYVLPPKQPNIHKKFSQCKNRNISQMCHNNHHMLPSTTEAPPKAKIKEQTQATKNKGLLEICRSNIALVRMPRKNNVKENPTH